MCVIAVIPKDQEITKANFLSCWSSNPHGGGLMYSDGSKVQVSKVLRKPLEFWEHYVAAKKRAISDVILHFRISTSGGIDIENTHPFPMDDGLWLCHNGILPVTVPKRSKINDTQIFIRDFLYGLPMRDEIVREVIGRFIGGYNKFAIMTPEGETLFVNKERGVDLGGIWYSNDDWTDVRRYEYYL